MAVTIDDVRKLASTLPRTEEALVRDRVKFRVGRIVYLAFSHDETLMGFGFPKEEREALVGSEPDKFLMPRRSDLRYNWAVVRLAAIDHEEMRELVLDGLAHGRAQARRRRTPRRLTATPGQAAGLSSRHTRRNGRPSKAWRTASGTTAKAGLRVIALSGMTGSRHARTTSPVAVAACTYSLTGWTTLRT